MQSKFQVTTPQILWHGGGVDHGKPDPVYSVDFHPKENVILTTGIDANVPPKGSVRLWKVNSASTGEKDEVFLVDFSDHQSVVNIARFSPCGQMIASASEKQIVIYRILPQYKWSEVEDIKQVERMWIRPSLNDIFDLDWSPDSVYIVIGALEGKGEIIRIATRDNILLPGHTNYVQGVAWDPWNKMVVTQSADRSCKVHQLKCKENVMVKLAPRGHTVLKMWNSDPKETNGTGFVSTSDGAEGEGNDPGLGNNKGINLFADSNVPSSFRRVCFSPDGSLILAPTGLYRQSDPVVSNGKNVSSSSAANQARLFCTHVYLRDTYQSPVISLVGLDDPSVAIRCCPRLFKLMTKDNSKDPNQYSLFKGDYRMVFAVVTITSVLVYDTQHPFPLAKIRGVHYAPINDAAWSADARVLTVCSSDGYLSFIRFPEGSLGEFLEDEKVPEVVKQSHPCLYNYTPPPKEKVENSASTPVTAVKKTTPKSTKKSVSTTSSASNVDAATDAVEPVTLVVEEDVVRADKNQVKIDSSSSMEINEAPADAAKIETNRPAKDVTKMELGTGAETPSTKSDSISSTHNDVAPESVTKKRKRIQPQVVGGLGCVTLMNAQFSPQDKRPVISSSSASQSASSGIPAGNSTMEPIALDDTNPPHNSTSLPLMETPAHTLQHTHDNSSGVMGSSGDSSVPSSAKKKRIQPILVSPLKNK